jgi:putative phage-type endonuclease
MTSPSVGPQPVLTPYQEIISCDGLIDKLLHRFGKSKLAIRRIIEIVNHVFDHSIQETYIQGRIDKIQAYQEQLGKLRSLPIVEQRTEPWYKMRETMITASDFAQALGKGKYGSPKQQQKEFFAKKSGHDTLTINGRALDAMRWGTLYEPMAQQIYTRRTGLAIYEFGLLPHPHVDFFGASPDGINEQGIMIEIKCPKTREINGTYPIQYYFQMQGQMDVCALKECDYVECQMREYQDADTFWASYEADAHERGIVVELQHQDGSSPTYMYSDISLPKAALMAWLQATLAAAPAAHAHAHVHVHYWQVEVFNVMRVYHDAHFVRVHMEALKDIWQRVQLYRSDKELYLKEVGLLTKRTFAVDAAFTGYCMLEEA